MPHKKGFDVIIIGGSYAGLSAVRGWIGIYSRPHDFFEDDPNG